MPPQFLELTAGLGSISQRNIFFQEISRSILYLYEMWKSFDEKKEMAQILTKMPKPKVQPPQQQQSQQQHPMGHSQMNPNN